MGASRKKNNGRRWARRPWNKKKHHGRLKKKKTMGSAPFFKSPFFRAHDHGIPTFRSFWTFCSFWSFWSLWSFWSMRSFFFFVFLVFLVFEVFLVFLVLLVIDVSLVFLVFSVFLVFFVFSLQVFWWNTGKSEVWVIAKGLSHTSSFLPRQSPIVRFFFPRDSEPEKKKNRKQKLSSTPKKWKKGSGLRKTGIFSSRFFFSD